MNVLISGANGYLGSNIINHLFVKGCEISYVDKSYNIINKQLYYDVFLYFSNPNEISFNLNSDKAATDMLNHYHALKALLDKVSVNAILYASTLRVYDRHRSPYSLMHELIEKFLQLYSSSCKIKLSCLRFGNVFGGSTDSMTKRHTLVPHIFIKQALYSNRIKLMTNGTQCRDFVPIPFVYKYIDNILENYPKTIDICTGVNFQIKEIAKIVSNLIPDTRLNINENHIPQNESQTNHKQKKFYATIKFSKNEIKNELITVINQWKNEIRKI